MALTLVAEPLLAQQDTGVNESLARFSDMAFTTSFALLGVALVFAIVGYAKVRVRKVTARDAAAAQTRNSQLVTAGGGTTETTDTGTELPQDEVVSLTAETKAEGAEQFAGSWFRLTHWFAALGTIFLLGSIVLRGLATNRTPLGNMYEYLLMMLLFVMTASVLFLRKPGYRQLWPFVLLPVLILMAIAVRKLYTIAAPVMPALQSYWVPVHVTVVTLGCGILMLSGFFSAVYLLRTWHPKGAERGAVGALLRPLPSAESIDRMVYYATIVGFPIFGLGIILGAVWAESAWGRFWGWDPKETASFVAWIIFAGYLHARATTGWGPKRAAWISLLGLAAILFNIFFINLATSGNHSYSGLN